MVCFVSGFFVFAALFAGDVYEYEKTPAFKWNEDRIEVLRRPLPKVDAIVCLAGAKNRISAASLIWDQYQKSILIKKPLLYFAGLGHRSTWNTVLQQVPEEVRDRLNQKNVVLETESLNTEENARWLAHFAYGRNWKKILLVTSSYHMKRANFLFQQEFNKVEVPIQIGAFSVETPPFTSDEWRMSFASFRVTVLEYIKWLFHRGSLKLAPSL